MLSVKQISSDVRYNDPHPEGGYCEPKLFVTYWEVTVEGRERPIKVMATSRGHFGEHTAFYLYTLQDPPSAEKINLLGYPDEKTYDSAAVRWHEPMTPRTVCNAVADWLGLIPTYSYTNADPARVEDVGDEVRNGRRRRWPLLSRS